MAKQQTLTIVVPDAMADPAELVERALERFLGRVVMPARFIEDTDDVEGDDMIILIEED